MLAFLRASIPRPVIRGSGSSMPTTTRAIFRSMILFTHGMFGWFRGCAWLQGRVDGGSEYGLICQFLIQSDELGMISRSFSLDVMSTAGTLYFVLAGFAVLFLVGLWMF